MDRKKIIQKLLKEGFSGKTLLNMPDSQIKLLSLRFIEEQKDDSTTYVSKDEEQDIDKLKDGKKKFVTYEEDVKEEDELEDEEKEIKEWVEKLIQPEKVSVTTKDEIMEMIKTKLNEQLFSPEVEPDVAEPEVAPDEGTPTERPGKDPYHDPWKEPGKGPDPAPKFEAGEDGLPDFLSFDNIVSSVNETKIENLAQRILSEIKKQN